MFNGMISYAVDKFFYLIILIMLIRVLLTWIPGFDWGREPQKSLRKFTDYIFEPFRRIIPPVGMLDLSPIVAFIAVQILNFLCVYILRMFGL